MADTITSYPGEVGFKSNKNIPIICFSGNLEAQPALIQAIIVVRYMLVLISNWYLVGIEAVFGREIKITLEGNGLNPVFLAASHHPVFQ